MMDLLALRPSDTPEYMTSAWLDCIRWAIGEPDIYAAFEKDTGIHWKPARNGFDRLIDQATGAEEHAIEAFVRWVNTNLWGRIDGAPDGD